MGFKVVNGGNKRKARVRVDQYMERIKAAKATWGDRMARVAMIQQLIPLGLMAIEDALQEEVASLVGARYARGGEMVRWGSNPGSVFLGEQKVSVRVPRVRDRENRQEIPLEAYRALQDPATINDAAFRRVLSGISTAKYERAAGELPEAFGIKRNAVSRRFIEASSAKLREFNERDISMHDIVAIFIDGKAFGDNEMIIAVGITLGGDKIILGFVESSTENHEVCSQFIGDLMDRGLNTAREILFIADGSKGLRKGIKKALGAKAIIQRCQWHKRENIAAHFDGKQQERIRRKLQKAYGKETEAKARAALESIGRELKLKNESAHRSFLEGFEETLTVYRLGVGETLAKSLRTTNCIENINSLIGGFTDRVDHWRTSNQRQRWVASALLEIEPQLQRVRGHQHLPALRASMATYANKFPAVEAKHVA